LLGGGGSRRTSQHADSPRENLSTKSQELVAKEVAMRRASSGHLQAVLVSVLAMCLFAGMAIAQEGSYGGTLRVAVNYEVGSLDMALDTTDLVSIIGIHIWETLYVYDSGGNPIPYLAEGLEFNEDGTVVTISLRQGVLFHNGEEMDSGDVAASLERAFEFGKRSNMIGAYVTDVATPDKYTVVLTFSAPFGPLTSILAHFTGGSPIMPAEIAEAAGGSFLETDQYIGTGPYQFVEHIPGVHLKLERFDDYSVLDQEPDGYGGRRIAYADEILVISVPESDTRYAGVEAGDYDYGYRIAPSLYDLAVADPELHVLKDSPPAWNMVAIGWKEGPLSDPLLREAVKAALDFTEITALSLGNLGEPNPSIMVDTTPWYTLAGTEWYNKPDPDKAKDLMAQAGYDGEPIVFLSSASNDVRLNSSIVITRQLTNVGFNVDLKLYDWATVVSLRGDMSNWDLLIGNHGGYVEPAVESFLNPAKQFGWDTPEITALTAQLIAETEYEARFAVWEQIQTLLYSDGVLIKLNDGYEWHVASATRLGGADITPRRWLSFWNVWIKD
jgi:peptide/nickel transport system substrate-binding protein